MISLGEFLVFLGSILAVAVVLPTVLALGVRWTDEEIDTWCDQDSKLLYDDYKGDNLGR